MAPNPYFYIRSGQIYEIHHDDRGFLFSVDCLGEAENWIAQLREDDAAHAAQEAREADDDFITDALLHSLERAA